MHQWGRPALLAILPSTSLLLLLSASSASFTRQEWLAPLLSIHPLLLPPAVSHMAHPYITRYGIGGRKITPQAHVHAIPRPAFVPETQHKPTYLDSAMDNRGRLRLQYTPHVQAVDMSPEERAWQLHVMPQLPLSNASHTSNQKSTPQGT